MIDKIDYLGVIDSSKAPETMDSLFNDPTLNASIFKINDSNDSSAWVQLITKDVISSMSQCFTIVLKIPVNPNMSPWKLTQKIYSYIWGFPVGLLLRFNEDSVDSWNLVNSNNINFSSCLISLLDENTYSICLNVPQDLPEGYSTYMTFMDEDRITARVRGALIDAKIYD